MKTKFRLQKTARYFLYTLCVCVLFTSCDNDIKVSHELTQFRGLKSPIIVISKGTVLGDCRVIIKDSVGTVVGFIDNGFESVVKGDTIVYAR